MAFAFRDTDAFSYCRNKSPHSQGYCMSCRDAMPRVFSPTGSNVKFVRCHLVLNQDFQDVEVFIRRNITFVGVNGIRPPMIQVHFPICGTMGLVIHVLCAFAHYLNEYLLAMLKWQKKK